MSDNIIDFNEHLRARKDRVEKAAFTPENILEQLESLPQNGLLHSVLGIFNRQMLRQMAVMQIAGHVSETLSSVGFDPDDFQVDVDSLNRFLTMDDYELEQPPVFGPCFDWLTDTATVRASTTLSLDGDDEDGDSSNLSITLLKLEDGAENWQVYHDGKWTDDGPPADFFDLMDIFDGEDPGDEDWDDEDEDWDEEEEDDFDLLDLSPLTIRTLVNAGICTLDQLREMTDEELLRVEGIGKSTLRKIRRALESLDALE